MAFDCFTIDGAEFVTNNYVAILDNDGVNSDFHLIQDLLRIK